MKLVQSTFVFSFVAFLSSITLSSQRTQDNLYEINNQIQRSREENLNAEFFHGLLPPHGTDPNPQTEFNLPALPPLRIPTRHHNQNEITEFNHPHFQLPNGIPVNTHNIAY
ncbi:uncharacterized protein LOC117179824 [Belonocnema kinseyi]|uniref:uncharacterized protein LOC117179824 n=1 Tax=Belonocnema kinseyi TaxID=2817044 RepID=UPI00143DC55D|nr:uncharacterized protein LOC117179824 [Belonocnema kinseyi]